MWDRFRDQPFYLSQQAVRNVADDADVVLYLVNASEAPADAGYLAPELDVLAWIGRPVFVLLNQTGRPRPRAEEEADESRWRDALGQRPFVRGVLTLDAFARCWVQEIVLLRALAPAIPPVKQPAYERLVAAWQARRGNQFEQAMAALAAPIARAAADEESAAESRAQGHAARRAAVGRQPDRRRPRTASAHARALAERLDAGLRESTDRLIAIHGLEGRAADEVRERLVDRVRTDAPMHEGKAAMMGGVLSGALTGLAADLAAGGLTFGAGTLVGALAGAAGGAGHRARLQRPARAAAIPSCAGTTNCSTGWSPPRCCATSPSRTSAAAAANGRKPSTRPSGARWCRRRVDAPPCRADEPVGTTRLRRVRRDARGGPVRVPRRSGARGARHAVPGRPRRVLRRRGLRQSRPARKMHA